MAFALVIALGLKSCNNDSTADNETARIQLKLVDSPGDYEEVNIEIIDIQYNSSENEGGWTSFSPENGYPIQVDLTKLIAGNNLLLTDEIIPSGKLDQIRLVLSDNNTIVIEGEAEPIHLDTPSAEQSGLKLKLDTELESGFTYTFILDWDVQKSIVKAGNSGKYILKPVLRVNTEVNSGSISGKVIGDDVNDAVTTAVALEDIIVKIYKQDDDTEIFAQTLTNENGDFLFQGLSAGNYTLKIEDNRFIEFESEDTIQVKVGEVFDAGTIELIVPVN